MISFDDAMADLPLVAILRGIRPAEVDEIGIALVQAGFRLLEVPLNSPEPFRSIEMLAGLLGDAAVIGGGTVMTPDRASRVVGAGGRLVVTPHCDVDIIRAAKAAGAWCVPGVATPTEAFAAMRAGADALKLFPAEGLPPAVVKALKAVLLPTTRLLPVGGITPDSMPPYVAAGAAGFAIGSALYKPGIKPEEITRRAADFVKAWHAIRP
jgi:2-dehydro-3-deoxyphosphogalactonate aldolase